jgi:Zn-dependent protease with chaperone function
VLSFLLPGLGFLFLGRVSLAFAAGVAFVVLPPLWSLSWAGFNFSLAAYFWGDKLLTLGLRLVAALTTLTLGWNAKPSVAPAPGLYGVFILGTIVSTFALSNRVQLWVPPPVQLSESAFGLESGEYVQARKLGLAAAPQPGRLALYVVDPPDAGANPLAMTRRGAFVGRVLRVESDRFELTGADAAVGYDNYVGEPAGVILSRDEAGIRWSRLGTRPVDSSTPLQH